MSPTATPSLLERIFSVIPQLAAVLRDPTVTEIMVNRGGAAVFIERDGRIEPTALTIPTEALESAIVRIAHGCGDDISEEQPLLEGRLEDGSRVAAMLPPNAVDGAILTIRKFGHRYTLAQLLERDTLTGPQATLLRTAVRDRQTILISGPTDSGKTTLLNALGGCIPDRDRVVLIEETSEILLPIPHVVRMESRRAQPKLGTEEPMRAVTIAELVVAALRHRPDRIILGEVRGGEAFDLIQSLNTGHRGSLCTIHANSALEALTRLAHCVLMSGVPLPYPAIREAIALAINLVVQIDRVDGQRRVREVLRVEGYDEAKGRFITSQAGEC